MDSINKTVVDATASYAFAKVMPTIGLFERQEARKPNRYPWTQDFIDAIWAGFWTPNEFNFKGDLAQFKVNMTEEEKLVIVRTLSAIGQIEIAVKRFWSQLGDNFPHPSMSDLGFVMANTEVIHNQAYEKLLDVLDLGSIFEDNLKEPVVAGRVKYLRKYLDRKFTDDRQQYIYSIILFTLFVENISLFSQFYVVLWFNRFHNVLKDTSQQVEYTRNEEALHAQVGIKIINTLKDEYPYLFNEDLKTRVMSEIKDSLTAEDKVIDWIIGDFNEPGLNKDILKQYIRVRMNESLEAIGMDYYKFDIHPDTEEQIHWMKEEMLGSNLTDFFHKRPVDYAKKNRSYTEEELF